MDSTGTVPAVAVSPRLPADVVVRPRLERRLLPPAAFTVVRGPSGSGKSTLLRQLADRMSDADVIWIGASARALTPESFWRAVALQIPASSEPESASATGRMPAVEVEPAVRDAVRQLQSLGRQIVLVLDDAHLVKGTPILEELFAVARVVPGLFVFIGTRAHLPSLECDGQKIEHDIRVVSPKALRVTPAEIAEFFEVSEDHAEHLHRVTEGHAALLRAVRAGELPTPGASDAGGAVLRVVRSYVRRFVEGAGAFAEDFLLRTGLADDFTIAEASEVSGDDNASLLVERLEEAGLLLRSPGDDGHVFRYPLLVQQVLRIDAARLGQRRVEHLHRTLALQGERRGDRRRALRHALHAREYEMASRMLLTGGTDLLSGIPYETFAKVPLRIAANHPLLAAARGLMENARGSRWTAQEFLAAAAIASRSTALRNLPERTAMTVMESAGQRMRGRTDDGAAIARRAMRLIDRLGIDGVVGDQIYMLISVCAVSFYRAGATADLRRTLDRVPAGLGPVPGGLVCGSLRAMLAAEAGDWRAFEQHEQALLTTSWTEGRFDNYRASLYQLALMLRDFSRADTASARTRMQALSAHMPTLEFRVLFAAAEGLAELIDGRAEEALRVVETMRAAERASGRLSQRDDHLLILVEALALAARSRMSEAYDKWERTSKESPLARIVGAHLSLVNGDTAGAAAHLSTSTVISAESPRIGRARLLLLSWLGVVAGDDTAAASSLLAAAEMGRVYGEDGSLMLLPGDIRTRLVALVEGDASPSAAQARAQLQADLPSPYCVGTQHPRLTARERVVLSELTGQRTVADVAAALGISPNTAKAQLRSAYRKLGASNRAEALVRVALLGISLEQDGR